MSILPDHSGVVLHESGYLRRNAPWNFPDVFSPFWRLYYNFKPGHRVIFRDKAVDLGPDRVVLIPNYVRFDCAGDLPVPSFWLAFSCARQYSSGQPVPIELVPMPAETRLIEDLVGFFEAGEENHTRQIFSFSLALLQVVLSRPELLWSEETPKAVTEATRYIEEHFASELYNRDLSRIAGLSTRTLTRIFRKNQGVSPAHFIAQVRVRKAAHLLLTSDASIEEISEKVGFRDRAYFTRVFTRLTHESPASFRRKHRHA